MFKGGKGSDKGQFDSPTGIAVDSNGNILVADTGNGRIGKFSPTGTFLSTLGTKGAGHGQFRDPNGIAIDRAGNIYVAEAGNHRVQKLAPDGTFSAGWKGPEPGFYGPRRIAIGPDGAIYVVDQGHNRIAKFSPDGEVLSVWGSPGMPMDNSMTLLRSQLIRRLTKFMSPIRETSGYRYLTPTENL
jgi:DNA-binding beta-propeller fold protein YncE